MKPRQDNLDTSADSFVSSNTSSEGSSDSFTSSNASEVSLDSSENLNISASIATENSAGSGCIESPETEKVVNSLKQTSLDDDERPILDVIKEHSSEPLQETQTQNSKSALSFGQHTFSHTVVPKDPEKEFIYEIQNSPLFHPKNENISPPIFKHQPYIRFIKDGTTLLDFHNTKKIADSLGGLSKQEFIALELEMQKNKDNNNNSNTTPAELKRRSLDNPMGCASRGRGGVQAFSGGGHAFSMFNRATKSKSFHASSAVAASDENKNITDGGVSPTDNSSPPSSPQKNSPPASPSNVSPPVSPITVQQPSLKKIKSEENVNTEEIAKPKTYPKFNSIG